MNPDDLSQTPCLVECRRTVEGITSSCQEMIAWLDDANSGDIEIFSRQTNEALSCLNRINYLAELLIRKTIKEIFRA